MLRVHRIPYSTDVERVAIAAALKGLEVEWVDHDPGDRTAVRALSGQDLVPVAELDGDEVVVDSMRIVERLEALAPEPALYPEDPEGRALVDLLVSWFNRVWKVAPNAIEALEATPSPDRAELERLGAELGASRAIFEGLLSRRPFLAGDAFTAADLCAYPFLRWAALEAAPPEAHRFEHILVEELSPGLAEGFPRLADWIARVDGLARAASSPNTP